MTDYRFHIYRPGEGYLCDDPKGDLSWYVEDFTNPFVCAFSSPSDARDHMATNDTICVSVDGQLREPIDMLEDFDGAPYPSEVQEAFKVRGSELLAEIERLKIAEAIEKTRAKLGMEVRSFVNDLPPIKVLPFKIPPHDEVDPDRLMKAFVRGLERPKPPTDEQRAAEILAMASTPSAPPTVKRSEYLADSRRTFELVETTGRVVVVDDETGDPCFVLSIPTTPISFSTEVEPPTPSQVEARELNVHVELGAMVSDPAFRDRTGANAPEPPPQPSQHPAVWDLVLRDIEERDKAGAAKYGTRLQPHNGRRPLVDAYQEALDLVVYLRQEIYERYGE